MRWMRSVGTAHSSVALFPGFASRRFGRAFENPWRRLWRQDLQRSSAAHLNWLVEGSFTEHDLNVRAPDLHLADVLDIGRHDDALVELVGFNGAAFDLELL